HRRAPAIAAFRPLGANRVLQSRPDSESQDLRRLVIASTTLPLLGHFQDSPLDSFCSPRNVADPLRRTRRGSPQPSHSFHAHNGAVTDSPDEPRPEPAAAGDPPVTPPPPEGPAAPPVEPLPIDDPEKSGNKPSLSEEKLPDFSTAAPAEPVAEAPVPEAPPPVAEEPPAVAPPPEAPPPVDASPPPVEPATEAPAPAAA